MRLINANKLKLTVVSQINERHLDGEDWDVFQFISAIDDAPTVDPVRHGHWIKGEQVIETEKYSAHIPFRKCSVCGEKYNPSVIREINYCYHCGTKMDGGENETN